MNNYYAWVAVVCEDEGKYYAHTWRLNNKSNILSQLKPLKAETVHLCGTKKEARELVEFWNDCYRKNGTYMFDTF